MLGDSYVNEMTKISRTLDNERWKANTLLLDLAETRKMFIGHHIYTFINGDKIEKGTSNMGNINIAYSVGYGNKNVIFLDYSVHIPYDNLAHNKDIENTSFELYTQNLENFRK